jgi:Ni,Fe-hydrogenase III small subunit
MWKTVARHLLSRAAPARTADPAVVKSLREKVGASRLGRSLAIRHVPAGSCNACELELRATQNLVYDLTQYGLSFTPSPRHADILLVTGVSGKNMREALLQARAAMPEPALVVAVGDCAVDGGVFKGSPAICGGTDSVLPVDLMIPGCPPSPERIVQGLLALVEANDVPARAATPRREPR